MQIRHVIIGGIVASLVIGMWEMIGHMMWGAALGFLWSRVGAQSGQAGQPAAS